MTEVGTREPPALGNTGFVLSMASWANSLPTAQKVLSPCTFSGNESNTRPHFLPACTICPPLTNIILLSTIQRKKLKHLPLPLIHGCMFRFLLLVGPNLPWHHFPWSQIFGVLQQMRNRFQGVACVAQFPQGRLPGLVPFIFRCERRNSSGSRGRECSQLKAWTSQPKDWMRSQLTTMSH